MGFLACRNEVADDYLIGVGNCINISDADEREECETETREERKEGKASCKEQFEARLELCDLVGEKRYDPDFDPENFVNPLEIGQSVAANPYLHLVPGTKWVYEGKGEVMPVTVTENTKLIDGVTCIVVKDLVTEGDAPIEDTDDWCAQELDGNVWY